jgi:hypothetical protein
MVTNTDNKRLEAVRRWVSSKGLRHNNFLVFIFKTFWGDLSNFGLTLNCRSCRSRCDALMKSVWWYGGT